jgi:Periplasmic component of the Tol biopolymer transport system
MKRVLIALVVVLASAGVGFAQTAKRPLSLDDLGKLKEVRDPQCAPDGKSVAFVVSQIDVKDDKPGASHIWTVELNGQNERQLTTSTDSESAPRFSPTDTICRSPRRGPARRRAIRSGSWTAAAARRISSPN